MTPTPEDIERDPLRWCVYCKADCREDEPEHGPDCPEVTGLFPVTMRELGMRGPDDPYAHGMVCMDCGAPFKLGDVYAHRVVEDEEVEFFDIEVREVVCVGCKVLSDAAEAL